jgi:ABC-type branched-subunit amino acid transport system ATPase component
VDAIVLIEHVMDVIKACCPRTAVLASGQLLTVGATADVLRDAAVAAVYLGTGETTRKATRAASSAVTTPAPSAGTATTHAATAKQTAAPLLDLKAVVVNFGGVRALRGVTLSVQHGEALALLGANGAGKTTLARAISGVVPLTSGSVHLNGESLGGALPEAITARGIGHCMEGRRIFASLSVEENLLLALPTAEPARRRTRLDHVYTLFPALKDCRHKPGTAMSGGQQQMLAIARAMMNEPQLLLLDEVSLGLAPIAVEQLYATLEDVRAAGVAMLVVEQNIVRGLQLADRACVLVHGEVKLQGTADQIRTAPELRALYVGEAG